MPEKLHVALLSDRAIIEVSGPDWRSFLQGLLSQDVEALAIGDLRFGALLTPQGRLLYDVFILGAEAACLLDCSAERADALLERLQLYRLRANVTLAKSDLPVAAMWGRVTPTASWRPDPRLPALGFRGYGALPSLEAEIETLEAYESHRMGLGIPGPADWGVDRSYPIEADFDLLNGIDFKKGCFVGQETTSRMKRRGAVKSRLAAIAFEGDAIEAGTELLAGNLRAGLVCSSRPGRAIASLRLDRLTAGELIMADGRPWLPDLPDWLTAALADQPPHRSQGHS